MSIDSLDELRVDTSIDVPITQHFANFPIERNFFDSGLQPTYQIQFLMGLLTSIVSAPHANIRYKYVFVRRIYDNLRIFVVKNGQVFFHNIFSSEYDMTSPTMTSNEFSALRNKVPNFDRIMPNDLAIENYVYRCVDFQNGDKGIIGLQLLSKKVIIHKISEKASDGNVPDLKLRQISSQWHLFKTINDKRQISVKNLRQMINAIFPIRVLEDPSGSVELIAKAGYIHGFLFKSFHKAYTTLVIRSPLRLLSYKKDVLSMCLPSNQEPNQFVMQNFGENNQAGYHLLFETARNGELIIHQANIAGVMTAYQINGYRIVQGTLENILYHMQRDIMANILKGRQVSIGEYSEAIHGFLMSMGITDIGAASSKAFLYGLMRTAPVEDVHVAYKEENRGLCIEALLIEFSKSKYLLTFDAEGRSSSLATPDITPGENNILHVNLATPSPGHSLEMHSSYTTIDEIAKSFDLESVGPLNLKSVLRDMVKSEAIPLLKEHAESVVRDLFQESIDVIVAANDFTSYLDGVFAHFEDVEEIATGSMSDKHSWILSVDIGSDVRTVHFSVLRNQEDATQSVISIGKATEKHSLSVAYNVDRKDIAIFGLDSETRQFNTENVNRACGLSARRKRDAACSFLELDKDNEIRIDDKEIKHLIEKTKPALNEHLSKIYEVSGKVQLGFLARDAFGDLMRGDIKALMGDALFFGTMIGAQKMASLAINTAEKMASSALSNGLKSFGLCLPNLLFDGYMASQIIEQIKNKDIVGASITGTFIALDILQCILLALAAFGAFTLNPLIIPALTIGSTILLVGVNLYDTVEKVNEIDHIVHLSAGEYGYEFVREFLHIGTDTYIQHLVDEKTANEYMASQVFKTYPSIKRFLMSASVAKGDKSTFIDDNQIDLTHKRSIQVKSRVMPEESSSRSLFCAMSEEPHTESVFKRIFDYEFYEDLLRKLKSLFNKGPQPFDDFFCHNAFGISTTDASHSEKTMFLLYDGNDNVTGFQYAANVFLIGNGSKYIKGGDQDDYFKIKADTVEGSFDGSFGYDTIDLSEYAVENVMRIENDVVNLMQAGKSFSIKNIEVVIGRQNMTDVIHVCNQSRIDLSGTIDGRDEIFVNDNRNKECQKPTNLTIYLRRETQVTCWSNDAKVTYLIMEDSDSIINAHNGSHHFYFKDLRLNDITILHFDTTDMSMKFGGTLTVHGLSNVSFEFEDQVKARILNDSMHAYFQTSDPVFEVIEKYNDYMAENQFITLVVETVDGPVFLSHNNYFVEVNGEMRELNVILDHNKYDAHLVAHPFAENYFLLFHELSKSFWNDIDLKLHTNGTVSHIDFHQFTRLIQNITYGDYGLQVKCNISDKHIVFYLQLMPNRIFGEAEHLGKVTVINGVDYLESISVHIYGTSRLEIDDKNVSLVPSPIQTNESVIVILPGQIDFDSNYYIDRSAHHMQAYFMNSTLMLTNSESAIGSVENYTTILLYDFLTFKNKYQTVEISFIDRKLLLRDFTTPMSRRSINKFWKNLNQTVEEESKLIS